jgi:hypothetical protein
MQNPCKPRYRAVVVLPVVMFALYTFAFANETVLHQSQQIALPATEHLILISLKASDNQVTTISQFAGEMIRTGRKDGEMLGITPTALDNGSVKLDLFRITKIFKGKNIIGEAITNIGSMVLDTASPQPLNINQITTIQLINISKVVRQNSWGDCPCCVTCGGVENCGASVQMSCGSCTCP